MAMSVSYSNSRLVQTIWCRQFGADMKQIVYQYVYMYMRSDYERWTFWKSTETQRETTADAASSSQV